MPSNIGTPAHDPHVIKIICGNMGLSVTHDFDWDDNPFDGLATLRIERVITAVRARAMYAPRDLVEACTVRGSPAICVHYEDDARGRTNSASILIIEDDNPDPYMTTLLLTDAGGIPFHELVKIAEGIR